MHNRPSDFLTDEQRQFLRAINFIPPPVKITPAAHIDCLFDQLEELLIPIRDNQHRRQFKG